MRVIIPVGDGRKSLISVADRPVLGHILDWVDGMDLNEVVIVGNFGEKVRSYVDFNYDGRFPISYVEQQEPQGSGEAVWLALQDIPRSQSPVLIVNGDTVPVGKGAVTFKEQMASGDKPPFSVLGVKEVVNPENYGVVELDRRQWVSKLVEKPKDPTSNVVMSGCYYLKRADFLFNALDTLIRYNVRLGGKFRLTGGLIHMFQFGELIQTQFVQTLDCSTHEGLNAAESYLKVVSDDVMDEDPQQSTSAQAAQNTQSSPELPILKRIDYRDLEAIDAAIADGFDFIGTLHSYELDIPELRSDIHISRVNGGGASRLDPNANQISQSDDLHPISPRYQALIDGAVQVGLSELRHSRLYTDPKIPFEMAQKVYEKRIRRAFQTSVVFVVSRDDEGVIGFCSLFDDEIELVAVASEYQRQGIGRRLVQSCIDECKESDFKKLKIKTQGSNRAAGDFYEKLGFKRTRIQKDFHRHKSKPLGVSTEEKPNAAILHSSDPGGC